MKALNVGLIVKMFNFNLHNSVNGREENPIFIEAYILHVTLHYSKINMKMLKMFMTQHK